MARYTGMGILIVLLQWEFWCSSRNCGLELKVTKLDSHLKIKLSLLTSTRHPWHFYFSMALVQEQCGAFPSSHSFQSQADHPLPPSACFCFILNHTGVSSNSQCAQRSFFMSRRLRSGTAIELNSLLPCRERLTARVKGYEIKSESEGSENERNAAKKKFSIKVLMYN